MCIRLKYSKSAICMCIRIIKLNCYKKNNFILLQKYHTRKRNPYEVLGLKKSSTSAEIKEAYIKLCKELHPDMKPGDTSQHKKFIELKDAYNALIKNSQRSYGNPHTDYEKSQQSDNSSNTWGHETPWYERSEYMEMVQRSKMKHAKKQLRVPNIWILCGCGFLIIIGSFLYLSAYHYATTHAKQKVDRKSKQISENYYITRKNALEKDISVQIDNMKKRWNTRGD